jgi:RNA polymerase sigma-70 factor (ECF subfamily)
MDSEQGWIDAAKRGDADAFGHLVTRHQTAVYRMVLRMVRDADDARELTQEAMLRAWLNLARFRGDAPFAGWLSRIALYLTLNHLRQQKKYVRPEDEDQHDAVIENSRDPDADPLVALLNNEAHHALDTALSELPFEFRIPLLLRVYEEYSYEEIAEALSLPIGTVMSRLFRARERVAQRVRELLGG